MLGQGFGLGHDLFYGPGMNFGRWMLLFFSLYVFLKASAWYLSVRFQIMEDTFSAWQFLVDMNLWMAAGIPTFLLARFFHQRGTRKAEAKRQKALAKAVQEKTLVDAGAEDTVLEEPAE